jgi:hypothetical protein
MRKFIKDLWLVLVERNKTHKALRMLNKQEWSIEFLTSLLYRAAKIQGQNLEMDIKSPDGMIITVRTADNKPTKWKSEDIFDHLDDEAAINRWAEQMGRAG